METLFISDLHLSQDRPEKLAQFRRLLTGPARAADALYILGDLVDQFWVGNDDRTPPNPELIRLLRDFTRDGPPCYVQRGNRDLLMDMGFESLTGCRLLADETVIDLYGEPALIMHGDLLCTRDTSYQLFRSFMERDWVRKLFLFLPYRVRTLLAHGLRPLLRRTSALKAAEIIDVDDDTVAATMTRHAVRVLVHGHTHRPHTHQVALPGGTGLRIVLADWYARPAVLCCRPGVREQVEIEEYLARPAA